MVNKYKKKPVIIEAVQYDGFNIDEIKEFCGEELESEVRDGIGVVGYFLRTLEGHSYILSDGDYIIKGVQGEFYPCKPDIFEQTYELCD